jgi:hypothetical protein
MKKGTSRRLTPQQRAELKSLAALRDDAIDTSDVPELLDWPGAKRGLFYRPVKQQLTFGSMPTSWPGSRAIRPPTRGIRHASIERCVRTCKGRQAGPGDPGLIARDGSFLRTRDAATIRRCS